MKLNTTPPPSSLRFWQNDMLASGSPLAKKRPAYPKASKAVRKTRSIPKASKAVGKTPNIP